MTEPLEGKAALATFSHSMAVDLWDSGVAGFLAASAAFVHQR